MMKKKVIFQVLFFVALVLFITPNPNFAQAMDIVEIDLDDEIIYYLYHYEKKIFMGQIFGAFNAGEIGYAIGIYWSNKSFLIEFPIGVRYSVKTPAKLKLWHTKINWFAAFPSWNYTKFEIHSINDFGWGVNGAKNRIFNRFEIIFVPKVDLGFRIHSFKEGDQKFSPYFGVIKRIKITKSISFMLYHGYSIEKKDWRIELDIFFTHKK